MSADRIVDDTPDHESDTPHPMSPRDILSTKVTSQNNTTQAVVGTPSRVTINVKDPRFRASPLMPAKHGGEKFDDLDSYKDELANSSEPEPSNKLVSLSPHMISPPSSPSRSPEIEVAEVEDMNQEPGNTRWRPLSDIADPVKIRDDLWAIFPCRAPSQNVLEAADELARRFHQGPIEDGILFRKLAQWIRRSHRATASLSLPLRPNDDGEGREAFEYLLASFTALTFRMVEIDCQTFEKWICDNNTQPELVSFGYLEWLCLTLSTNKSALWRNMQTVYDYNATPAISLILEEVCRPWFDGSDLLSRLLRNMLHQAQSVGGIAEKTVVIFDIIHRTIDHYHLVRRGFTSTGSVTPLPRQNLLVKLYSFFQAMDSILQKFITKQVTVLTHDLCETIICQLAMTLQKITTASNELTSRALHEELGLVQNFYPHNAAVIAEEAWKFRVFRKCFLEGRMEIRIQGVESMQHALVQIHRKYIQGTSIARQHPVVSFLCDFILNNKLIDYLVGVESHPRLIRLTGNIVGFLVVSQRFTEAESDRIWETVIKSQDSGVVGAILQMLPSIFNIAHFSQLLYLVTKLNGIPVSAWDSKMTAYADHLFKNTVTKWNELQQGRGMDKAPYQCCIRLIREASSCEPLAFSKRRQISMFASTSLETLLDVGPSDHDRLQIYEDCIGDIAARTSFATGSICVINILLRHDTEWDIGRLAKDFALADLVIAEFEQMISRMSQGLQDPRFFDESLNARLDLLQQIIMLSPDYINIERGWRLWDTLVGSKAPSHLARDSALIMLVNATMSLRKRNSFIDACISDYLPKLPPRFFTSNLLFFVTQVFQYGNFVEQIDADTEFSYSDRLGMDMLWRVALVAPAHTVECKAIETLITTYLDSPKTQGMPKAAMKRMHVEVVERCVRQLATAASQLKAFTDGTSSGEDEPMVIVAPDEEVYLQRLSFSRSLLILQELVHRIRSHPSYSPVPSVRSQQYTDIEEINGNPTTIHYQPFSGGSSHSMKTIQVGDLEKVRDLMQRFAALTGFPNFTVIVGGHKVNREEFNGSTIRATRLHEKGLFLIKNMHGHESVPDLIPAGLVKPLEMEIMGHFSDFYRFLSLDESLARNVLEFLKAFPPDDYVISLVHSTNSPIEDVFPAGSPSKSLYSVYAFEQRLLALLQKVKFICHGIEMIAMALARSIDNGPSMGVDGEHRATAGLVECLLKFLKEAARTPTSSQILSKHASLATRLLNNISVEYHEDLYLASSLIFEVPLELNVPVLHSKTRHNLYNILLAMANDISEYHRLLKLVRSLLPQTEEPQAWSWGIARTTEDCTYDPNWCLERIDTIRASAGYAGLKNLTNTCYMNSLLTQLFMNAKFRRFMLGTDITDRSHSQRLLAETKTLFAFMQRTMLKAVDTQGIADSLVNYENTLIDVSLQMDVDEFYNLLFDRWESQILSNIEKKTFRGFYGGQIVQQIKSKECPHISERLEPFSAIQCDIQGKTTLTESLSAYVDGEIMEGGQLAMPVPKRQQVFLACLKDIPNDLIFHLKRFDYDIMTGMRHKVNDRFEFAERIDMAPYSIDFLQDTGHSLSPDIFELVGILVHTGTAESGHYYSYVRERSCWPDHGTTWVEFNDTDVTPFNPAQIPDLCFGGATESTGYPAASYPKSWNAYMLFYQRVGTADANTPQRQPGVGSPQVDGKLPPDLANRITIDNEKFLRKYCLYDTAHAGFTISLLDQLRVVSKSCCSDGHTIETDAVLLGLEYADQILSRMKDSADFEKLLDSLTIIIRGCSTCCKVALGWIADNKKAFRNLLLRCPAAKVRRSFTDMLVRALRYLRDNDAQDYGFDVDSIELKSGDAMLPELPSGILQRLVGDLQELWPNIHLYARAWDDYFGLLAAIAEFGAQETFLLLRADFLKLCLEVLIIESPGIRRLKVDSPHYNQLLRLIEKGRRYSLANLAQLLQALLAKVDLQARPFDSGYNDRIQMDSGKFPLSMIEESYLYYGTESGRSRPIVFLDKIITTNSNPTAVKKILQTMLLAEPRAGHLADISKTILSGINIDPADLAEPYLVAGLTFCETSPAVQTVKDMITQVAREVDTIGTSGGRSHLEFFIQARQALNPRIQRRTFNKLVLRTVSMWAPALLMYYDEAVRQATVDFLRVLIFHYDSTECGDDSSELEDYARGLCEACIRRVQVNVIQQQNQVDVKSVEVIRDVIKHCIAMYFQTGTVVDDQVAEEAEAVYDAIQILSVEEGDEACSDTWNNSDGDLPSDSGSENLLVSP
ncbi:MAG: hypothetical protein Q9185_001126 [Variospora sp. 1 TL-2023]